MNEIEFYKGPPLATQTAITADMAFHLASGVVTVDVAVLERPVTPSIGPRLSVTITENIPP